MSESQRALACNAIGAPTGIAMRKMYAFLGATAGGWIGWYAGATISMALAFVLSMIATGVGMYIGIRLAGRYS